MKDALLEKMARKNFRPKTYTFTWPIYQPKPSWWRRLLRLVRR